jgi:pyroglutamyl-peptidase
MTRTILLTGFGSFPGAPFNPTGPLVTKLGRSRRLAAAGMQRAVHIFPTGYAAVDRELAALLARHKPDAIVMFGLAARTRHMRIETQARNAMSVLFPDVDGLVPRRAAIERQAPARRSGRAPFHRLLAAARKAPTRVALSRDAGRYLCNYVYWRAIEAAAKPGGPRLVVFVHVPKVRGDGRKAGARAAMPTLADLARTGEAIALAALSALRLDRPADPAKAPAHQP